MVAAQLAADEGVRIYAIGIGADPQPLDHERPATFDRSAGRGAEQLDEVVEVGQAERGLLAGRDDDPEQAGLAGDEVPRVGVRPVAELLGDRCYPSPRGVRQATLAAQGVGDRGRRDISRSGHIPDPYFPDRPVAHRQIIEPIA